MLGRRALRETTATARLTKNVVTEPWDAEERAAATEEGLAAPRAGKALHPNASGNKAEDPGDGGDPAQNEGVKQLVGQICQCERQHKTAEPDYEELAPATT